jgi:hypothetical protein
MVDEIVPTGWSLTGPDADGHRHLVRESDKKRMVASTDPRAWAVQVSDFEFYDKLVESQKQYNAPSPIQE